jgi:hypothetical protein
MLNSIGTNIATIHTKYKKNLVSDHSVVFLHVSPFLLVLTMAVRVTICKKFIAYNISVYIKKANKQKEKGIYINAKNLRFYTCTKIADFETNIQFSP